MRACATVAGIGLMAIMMLGLAGCSGNPAPSSYSTGGDGPTRWAGKIAFISTRTGSGDIYTMNPDGTNVKRVTHNGAGNQKPSWSPDGTKIVCTSQPQTGNDDLYIYDASTGAVVKRLTNNAAHEDDPTWSRATNKIAFEQDAHNNWDIYTIKPDGTGLKRLTSDPAIDGSPAWSPDGSKIAFASHRSPGGGIFLMNADGSSQTRLPLPAHSYGSLRWSPDGQQITCAVDLGDSASTVEIYVVSPIGTGLKRLTNNSVEDAFPVFSPDSTKIAFDRQVSAHNREIYVMNASDGAILKRVTTNAAWDSQPDWWGP